MLDDTSSRDDNGRGTGTNPEHVINPNASPAVGGVRRAIEVKVVETREEFAALEESWEGVIKSADCSVFQTFEWAYTWWEHFGKGKRLHLLVFSAGSVVVGIAPMVMEKKRVLGLRLATFLRFFYGKPSFYSDLVIAAGYEQDVVPALANYLRSFSRKWDIFEMPEIDERLSILNALPSQLEKAGMQVFSYRTGLCSRVILPDTWEGYLQYIGGKARHEFKRKGDRFREHFQVETEIVEKGNVEVRSAVRELATIHGRRWESLGFKNRYADENEMSFLASAAERFSEKGRLKIMFLKASGEKVASLINFYLSNRIYCYHANVFGSGETVKYSPGILLHYSALQDGIASGFREYDMMIGQEDYKAADVKSVQSQVWMIRAIAPGRVHRFRFRLYLLLEIASKGIFRLQQEYHILKRYYVTKRPSAWSMLKYTLSELAKLWTYEREHFGRLFKGEEVKDEKRPEN